MAAAAMESFLTPSLCANVNKVIDGKIQPCPKAAGLACASCKLVQYCSKDCQKAHWPEHKVQCKSPMMQPKYVPGWVHENRQPTFIGDGPTMVTFGKKHYLWGNMPALDILKMEDNEGRQHLSKDTNLLFAASGDCRNVINSIVGLPVDYTGRCTAVLNDMDFVVVARNAIFLLSALHFDPSTSAPIMLHLWYSALIPTIMLETLQKEILPYIEDVCSKVKDKSPESLQAKTFKLPHGSLRLLLKKEHWFQLASFFKVSKGLTSQSATARRVQTMLNPGRMDIVDRALYAMPPGQRMACWKFRKEGILLPFGCSTQKFDTPNPTFFNDPEGWPMMDSADPLEGWLHADYASHKPIAKADVYGSLFFFLRDLFLKFCNRLQNTDVLFHLYNMDAMVLPRVLTKDRSAFDRIEIANICDRGYVGPEKSLSTFVPLLRPKVENPKATLIMLFLNAVGETQQNLGRLYVQADMERRMKRLRDMIGDDMSFYARLARGDMSAANDPEFIRRMMCYDMFADFDGLFRLFLQDVRMDELVKANGVKMKIRNTFVEKWPYRVTQSTSKEAFDRMVTSNLSGWERYVEIERME